MKFRLISCVTIAIASAFIFSFAASAQPISVSGTYKNITIDGSFGDWTGVPLAYNQAQPTGDLVPFQNLYVANDENYLYIRFSLYTNASPFTSKQNMFFDTDTNAATGYSEHGLGSEFLIQSGSGYKEASGIFNAGAASGIDWLSAPAVPAGEFEVRISRNATYADGSLIFTNNTIALFLESGESAGNEWFPNVTGGLLYTFASPSAALATNLPLVGLADSSWQVNASGTDLGTNWLDSTYDDSSWDSGLGLFGYTTSPSAYPAIQTALATGANTYYFRTHFNWNYQTANLAFVVTNYLSDGAVYYLNGIEVRRDRMPAGNVTYSTSASGTNSPEGQPDVFGISGGLLQTGDNILEVETHQAPASGSDMVFGLSLTAAAQYPATIVNPDLPADQTVTAGQSVTFTADVLGSSLNYQWLKGVLPITGATNATFTIPLVLTNDMGNYSLTIANTLATNTTRMALLTVVSTPVVINDTTQPADEYVVEGRPVAFNVAASGSALVSYQWFQGANAIAGATNASYSISSVNSTNAGTYYATVSNPASSTNSRVALLSVLSDTIPPAVTNITASSEEIVITFSEPVDPTTAGNSAYYILSGGLNISSVAVDSANQVTLTTSSPLLLGTTYSVTINGVDDLFGNAANAVVPFLPTIVIDGNFDDWAGLSPIYSGPSGSDGAADFKDIYMYNDANYYYFRVTLWHDIPAANGQFPSYVDMFYDTDNDSNTGYSAIGSDLLEQSGFFYQEKNGGFNDGVAINGMDYLIAPTVPATSFPADFEFRYSRHATFGDGTLVFPTNAITFFWEGQTPAFAVLNTAASDGSLISYTNMAALSVPSLPPGQLAVHKVGGNAVVVWDTASILQSTSSLEGNSWTNLPAAASPYVIPASSGQQFFRLTQ